MKVISIWQPCSTLIVSGWKVFETRTWSAPKSLIGQRLGIASTKSINPAQRAFCAEKEFVRHYADTGLGDWKDMPGGYLLGYATLDSVEFMHAEFMDDVTEMEKAFGYWEWGNYAWRLADPVMLDAPIPVVGKQGIWDWHGELPDAENEEGSDPARARREIRAAHLRRNLHVI